uniref:Uncharacterized protein n=1 Tax=viral metagenome TaxID=1070528 RepID=A0A6C0LT06_9ZZZZ
MRETITFALLIIIIFMIIIIYKCYNNKIHSNVEKFTALSGIEVPLTTYDDYGTFNFLFNLDDFPKFDHTYDQMAGWFTNWDPHKFAEQPKKCGSRNNLQSKDEIFKDSFIKFDGDHKLRRELVPANYINNNNFADADFDRNQLHLAVKKDRPRASAHSPQPYNIYFNKIPRDQND